MSRDGQRVKTEVLHIYCTDTTSLFDIAQIMFRTTRREGPEKILTRGGERERERELTERSRRGLAVPLRDDVLQLDNDRTPPLYILCFVAENTSSRWVTGGLGKRLRARHNFNRSINWSPVSVS